MKRIINKIRAILSFLSLYGQHLPLAIWSIFSIRCKVILIRGRVKKSQHNIDIMYVGRMQNFEYIRQQLLDSSEIVNQVNSTLLTYKTHANKTHPKSDAVVMDFGWPYHYKFNTQDEFLELPDWINMMTDTTGKISEVIAKFRKTTRANDLRWIRKYSYSYDLVNDNESIDYFYDQMYTPFVKNTHGAGAILAKKKEIAKRVKQGSLLRIHYQGQVLAAGVIYPEDNVLYFLWMGMLPELPPEACNSNLDKRLPDGVISALYYYGIEYANKEGMDAADFTGTRGILSDGTFHFKRKWGAIVEDTFSPSSILLKLNSRSKNSLAFTKSTPLIIRNTQGLEIRVVVDDLTSLNENEMFEAIWKQHGCKGIESICVIHVNDKLPEVIQELDFNGISCYWIQSHLDSFDLAYCKDYSKGS